MKINWGTSIVLSFIAFIAFILYFVVRMSTDDYYKQELAYQEEIDAEKSASVNSAKLQIEKTEEGLIITFPQDFKIEDITGKVSLYRPSNRHLDFNFPISLSKTHLLIPDNSLLDGRWDIAVKWKYKNKTFLHKEKLSY